MFPDRSHYINKLNKYCSIIFKIIYLLIYPNGRTPAIRQTIFVSKYHGCFGMELGTTFIFPGFLITFFLIPRKAPIKTKGDEQQSHKSSNVIIVENGIAPLDPSKVRNILINIKTANANDGYKIAVAIAFLSQSV